MTMLAWDTLLAVFASGAILDVWFNGSIFSNWQAKLQFIADEEPDPSRALTQLFAKLLTCSFCLSYHVPLWFLAPLVILVNCLDPSRPILALLLRFPLYWLAIVRISNLLDGLLPNRLRYKQVLEFNHAEEKTTPGESQRRDALERLRRGEVISQTVPGRGIDFAEERRRIELAHEHEGRATERDYLAAGFAPIRTTGDFSYLNSYDGNPGPTGQAAPELGQGPGTPQPMPAVREGSPQAGTWSGHGDGPPQLGSTPDC
jgi:hypothetical protein